MNVFSLFSVDGCISPQSNINFDASLRTQNAEWGYRDTRQLAALAAENQLQFTCRHDMPSNNHLLVFVKQ
jgi:hypothetical protein